MDLAIALNNSRAWNRHGVKIVWTIAVLLLILVIANIAYSEYSNHQAKLVDYAAQNLPPIQLNSKPKYRVTDITSANLFGDPRPKGVISKNIPKTNLNLKLIGVLWATKQGMARVIIQSGNKKANLYSIGDDIEGASASVKEIHSEEILIDRNGATEKLALVKKKSSKDIIDYESASYSASYIEDMPASYADQLSTIGRTSSPRPISPNGENRKIRKPNFSGLDRALKKMDEL